MATVSLCMIVRDEAPVLARCLESAAPLCEEILIADTGSVDETKSVAAQFTDRIYDFPWQDDFAAARNFIFSKAKADYQFWLDADDVLPPESLAALLAIRDTLTADVVMLPYHVGFDADGRPVCTFWRERLLRRECGFRWEGAVHEAVTPAGTILRVNAPVEHHKVHVNDPGRNLRIFEKQAECGHRFTAREHFYYARELMWNGRDREAVQEFAVFLQCPDGWSEDRISACLDLARCSIRLGHPETAREILCGSLAMGAPRAEICCEIGNLYLEQKQWECAVFWYEAALHCPPETGGFSHPDYRDFIPMMQLCVCHDRMGNLREATAYHERAQRLHPQHPAVLANCAYFRNKL